MRKAVFTTATGQSVALDSVGLYKLTNVSGVGNIPDESDIRRSPGQDGETWVSSVFSARPILLEGVIDSMNEAKIYEARRALSRIFNPKLGLGTLTYYAGDTKVEETGTGTKQSGVYVLRNVKATLPFFPERVLGQSFLINLVGEDPYWYTVSYNLEELRGWEGGLTFPITFPITFETRSETASVTVENNGDVDTPVEAWFRGPLTQAKLTNTTTGEFILIAKTLTSVQELYVNTQQGELDVVLTESGVVTSAWGALGEGNTFLQLQVGENQLTYDTAGAGVNTRVQVRYRDRFVGF